MKTKIKKASPPFFLLSSSFLPRKNDQKDGMDDYYYYWSVVSGPLSPSIAGGRVYNTLCALASRVGDSAAAAAADSFLWTSVVSCSRSNAIGKCLISVQQGEEKKKQY